VRTIVERHEGKAWVEATSSGGSTFAFRLPLVWRSGARGDAPR
jgi:light-regulated signal transduction histidine kinase (bacteriophytochrome)